jgi:hypothetical protein
MRPEPPTLPGPNVHARHHGPRGVAEANRGQAGRILVVGHEEHPSAVRGLGKVPGIVPAQRLCHGGRLR